MRKITIVGAGLSGTLMAILLAKRGYMIEIIERNNDPRLGLKKTGKSINLTLCKRGIKVLEKAGLKSEIQKWWVPAYGRHIHLSENQTETQPYGNHNEALYSVSREKLNFLLLTAALKFTTVSILFNKKCIGYDLDDSKIYVINENNSKEEILFDTLIAADGVHSAIRVQMQRQVGFNYSQFYSNHINKELTIPADKALENNLKKNHIHIWPRSEYMIIAFPNQDESFTCTLQLPVDNNEISFSKIKTEMDLYSKFNKLFPGVTALMPNLTEDFFQNPEIPMLTIRCSPWNVSNKVLLIGDAAHGVWPSYGQGANAGFEDCAELDECISRHPLDFQTAFVEFFMKRKENVDAIADLSENHFKEIRHLVADPNFLLRKKIERQINLLFPSEYFSTYSRVAFTTMPYKQAVSLEKHYNQMVSQLLTFPEIKLQPDSTQSKNLIYQTMNQFQQGVLV